jgi:hypothetical protein
MQMIAFLVFYPMPISGLLKEILNYIKFIYDYEFIAIEFFSKKQSNIMEAESGFFIRGVDSFLVRNSQHFIFLLILIFIPYLMALIFKKLISGKKWAT